MENDGPVSIEYLLSKTLFMKCKQVFPLVYIFLLLELWLANVRDTSILPFSGHLHLSNIHIFGKHLAMFLLVCMGKCDFCF